VSTYYFLKWPNRCLLLSSSLHPFSFAAFCEDPCVSVQLHASAHPFSFAAFCEHRCVSVQLRAYLLWSPRSRGATHRTVRRSPDLHNMWSQNRRPYNKSPMNKKRTMCPESRRKFCKGRDYLRSSY
jgi:hypothetical protein